MEFTFNEDQLLLQRAVRDFLEGECTPAAVRELWETETGRSPAFWAKLSEIGVPGLLVPEEHDGLGMDERDLVLVLEEAGRAALAEPVIATAAVGVPLLVELSGKGQPELAQKWLGAVARGEAMLAVGHARSPFVGDAHVADLLFLPDGDDLHAVPRAEAKLTAQDSNDQSQRLFSVDWSPSAATRVASGPEGAVIQQAAFDRGVLACAAQQLGVGQRLIDMGALYATQRQQFGVAIGSFQAVKHRLANAKVRVEYARAVVYRAAHSVATGSDQRAADVSMAKVAAGEAALFASKEALQVHGAIGYTYEQDLHIWMKRAWSLDLAFGTGAWHRARLADAIIDGIVDGIVDGQAPIRAFGYCAPKA